MIQIGNSVLKKQTQFWNHALFHPTDAVEDPWGKRILDRMADDGAIQTIRIYSMFEDIVYYDEHGTLCYDFRVSDLRLDYLLEKGYRLLIAYAGMPDCIASSTSSKGNYAKNKTRYKGKMWNSAPPRDYALWEEICYEYTKHNVERYGIETVSQWYCQCFNEPDIQFFFSTLPVDDEHVMNHRLPAYCQLYAAFERGIRRVSDRIPIGGPALARRLDFLGGWLDYVTENHLKLDFISVHNYGVKFQELRDGTRRPSVQHNIDRHQAYVDTVAAHGYGHLPLLVDEWGFCTHGFFNRDECPELLSRETEMFSAYFAKLIHAFIEHDYNVDMLCICLSGQHEMTEDFSGFRNFFTLNFIAKPIYNAYILASRLKENLLAAKTDNQNLFVVPTQGAKGEYAVMVSYSSEHFDDDLPDIEETVTFAEDLTGKTVTVWCIDKNTTNPYRLYQKMGIGTPTTEEIRILQEEGRIKPLYTCKGEEPIKLRLSSNAVFLITAE